MSETQSHYSTAQVAHIAGVHKDTLLRWLRAGLVSEPTRDRRGWRVFSSQEAEKIRKYADWEVTEAPTSNDTASSDRALKSRLTAIDWDFNGAKTQYLTHGLHPYPAKYIPQIPNALIQELSSVGDTVLDIFSGSGTTLVEAITLKRNAIGIDANPLATMISRAKTSILSSTDSEYLRELVALADDWSNRLISDELDLFLEKGFQSKAFRPADKAVNFWFESFIVEELAEILSWCKALKSDSSREIALTAFSSIVVSVSKQDSDTRYVRRDKTLSPGDGFKRFSYALSSAIRAAEEYAELVEGRFLCEIICADLLSKPKIGAVDLVVCSPPYPNAYSYHLYHMTRMLWLQMNQPQFKGQEIGSHRKYSSKSSNAATEKTFYEEMASIFDWLSHKLKKNGYACFVVGDSTIKGKKIDNADILSNAASRHDFVEIARVPRTIQKTKKSFNPKIGKIRSEKILVLKRK